MDTIDVGARLRSHRRALGLSVEDLARRTRVQPRILEAIERNDLAQIPPSPYGRGFIRAYAREVGIDPDDAVREYFGQFPPAPPDPARDPEPEPWPRQSSWILPACGLLVVALVLAAIAKQQPGGSDAANGPAPVGTAGSDNLEPDGIAALGGADAVRGRAAVASSGGGADRGTRQESAMATAAGFSVRLIADRVCWVAATADGTRVLYELLQPGTERTIRAEREVILRAGDAGALRLAVEGDEAKVFGRSGEVRTARITASDALRPAPQPGSPAAARGQT